MPNMNEEKGKMTVEEAGHKGGETTSHKYGRGFYQDIGHKGGQKGGPRVRELIREGEEMERNK